MKQIYLLRHAKSSWNEKGLSDFDRPLSRRGQEACKAVAAYLDSEDIRPELILCSAAQRTKDTLLRILPAFRHDFSIALEKQLYLASAAKLLKRLRGLDDRVSSVMLIGHNPGLQQLALLLSDKPASDQAAYLQLRAKFPTAALAALVYKGEHWSELEADAARIRQIWRAPKGESGAAA